MRSGTSSQQVDGGWSYLVTYPGTSAIQETLAQIVATPDSGQYAIYADGEGSSYQAPASTECWYLSSGVDLSSIPQLDIGSSQLPAGRFALSARFPDAPQPVQACGEDPSGGWPTTAPAPPQGMKVLYFQGQHGNANERCVLALLVDASNTIQGVAWGLKEPPANKKTVRPYGTFASVTAPDAIYWGTSFWAAC